MVAKSIAASRSQLRARSSNVKTSDAPSTFWENVARASWGRYVASIERCTLLEAHAAYEAPGVGLEVGCEGGRWCRLLTELGWRMIATETNRQALQLCQERNPNVHCIHVREDVCTLPVDTASIDLLLCVEVPVIDHDWFLWEASRVLKPGGIFVGSFMNLLSWRGIAANLKSKLSNKQPFYTRSYFSFRRSLRRTGFQIRTGHGYCWAPFGRHSDSRLVPLATALEQGLGLRRCLVFSPWIAFTAIRNEARPSI